MNTQLILLKIAGAGHFGIVIASALVPFALDWKRQLASLHPFMRTLFWVYGVFIVLATITFGSLTLLHAQAMADGEPVARSLAAVIAFYWGARLLVQWFVFDARELKTTIWHHLGDAVLTAAFLFITAVYAWAAIN